MSWGNKRTPPGTSPIRQHLDTTTKNRNLARCFFWCRAMTNDSSEVSIPHQGSERSGATARRREPTCAPPSRFARILAMAASRSRARRASTSSGVWSHRAHPPQSSEQTSARKRGVGGIMTINSRPWFMRERLVACLVIKIVSIYTYMFSFFCSKGPRLQGQNAALD